MDIRDKVVIITGASEGIGAACAEAFRKRGAKLALCARSRDKLAKVGGTDALVVAGNLCDGGLRRRLVESTVKKYGRVDILINNAGVGFYAAASQAAMPETRALFELNFFAPLDLTQLVVPHMRAQHSGMIVNIGSVAGKITLPWFTLYSVSKYALGSLTDGLRLELKRDGIHAMQVCPGYVRTDFQKHILGGTVPGSVQDIKRFVISAEQCAEAIAQGVEKNTRTVVTPRSGWFLVAFARMFPKRMDKELEKIYKRRAPA